MRSKDEVLVESELRIWEDDYTISIEGEYPKIDRTMAKIVVVHLFGKKIGYKALVGHLQSFGGLTWRSRSEEGSLCSPDGGEYDGLLVIYYECGCYGHTKESCPKWKENDKKVDLMEPTVVPTIDTMIVTISGVTKDSVSLYRPWMQALTRR
ncbi:hypothetical protein J1N35_022229 [Gossypium stocksii]|uniref:CCHC-type domain-containing protein n=1 Tax=Gossypium stocksii TaxID=47602 RepID=A0A9D3VG83_9ROSI|nr:hypothetical protein J1N35_022229 [Gossypium stocksii]